MRSSEVEDAIDRVREVHRRVAEAQRFSGYSGRARALGGTLALAASFLLSREGYPATVTAHLVGWGLTCAGGAVLNYGALACWLLLEPAVRRDLERLRPTLAPLPALLAGGVLSAALVSRGQHDLLFGTWMMCFGLANLSSVRHLPRVASPAGIWYLACGAALLTGAAGGFLDPWPMGLVFGAGEWASGLALFFGRRPTAPLLQFFGLVRRSP